MSFRISTHTFTDERTRASHKYLAIMKGKRLFAFYPDVEPTMAEARALQSRLVFPVPIDREADWKR